MERAKRIILQVGMAILVIAVWVMSPTYAHPETYKIKNFKTALQPDNITCGPTSAFMVLEHHQISTNLDEVKAKTKTEWFDIDGHKIGMTSPDYIVAAMKNYGLKASLRIGELKEIKYYVSKGRPVIVLLRSGKWTWHYVVVIGYDKDGIWIANPASGAEEKISTEIFLSSWNFKTDMGGNKVVDICSFCNGLGQIFPTILGKCDVCGGTGIAGDFLNRLIQAADIKPNTYIEVRKK